MPNNPVPLPTDIERRAYKALTQAFCELRYYAKRPLNGQGKEHLFLVADAAHNIPSALAGNPFFVKTLERDIKELESMLGKMGSNNDQEFYEKRPMTNNTPPHNIRISLILALLRIAGVTKQDLQICNPARSYKSKEGKTWHR